MRSYHEVGTQHLVGAGTSNNIATGHLDDLAARPDLCPFVRNHIRKAEGTLRGKIE